MPSDRLERDPCPEAEAEQIDLLDAKRPPDALDVVGGLLDGKIRPSRPRLPVLGASGVDTFAMEDRILLGELASYEEYAARTRYRLVPGLW